MVSTSANFSPVAGRGVSGASSIRFPGHWRISAEADLHQRGQLPPWAEPVQPWLYDTAPAQGRCARLRKVFIVQSMSENRAPVPDPAVLRQQGVPPFNADRESGPAHPAVAEMRELIDPSDALLIVIPEYNKSIREALKNALDWASRAVRSVGPSDHAGSPRSGRARSPPGPLWRSPT